MGSGHGHPIDRDLSGTAADVWNIWQVAPDHDEPVVEPPQRV
jgi:hypothetical protein